MVFIIMCEKKGKFILKGIYSFLKKLKFLVWKMGIRIRKNLDLDLDKELWS